MQVCRCLKRTKTEFASFAVREHVRVRSCCEAVYTIPDANHTHTHTPLDVSRFGEVDYCFLLGADALAGERVWPSFEAASNMIRLT